MGRLKYKSPIARATCTEDSIATALTTPQTQRASNSITSKSCLGPECTSNEAYFRFTRGRFIYNEKHELSQRYVRFNVQELARIAAEAVGSKSCVGVEKYPDSMYNKALLLKMEGGAQIVAKNPNPDAGRPHVTTASEVATMDFVRAIEPYHACIAKKKLGRVCAPG